MDGVKATIIRTTVQTPIDMFHNGDLFSLKGKNGHTAIAFVCGNFDRSTIANFIALLTCPSVEWQSKTGPTQLIDVMLLAESLQPIDRDVALAILIHTHHCINWLATVSLLTSAIVLRFLLLSL